MTDFNDAFKFIYTFTNHSIDISRWAAGFSTFVNALRSHLMFKPDLNNY
jgi:hypothetical protein